MPRSRCHPPCTRSLLRRELLSDSRRLVDRLRVVAQPALEECGIEVDLGVAAALQGAVEKDLYLLVDLLTDRAPQEIPCIVPRNSLGPLRLTCDSEMPLWELRAATSASTLRVEMPPM